MGFKLKICQDTIAATLSRRYSDPNENYYSAGIGRRALDFIASHQQQRNSSLSHLSVMLIRTEVLRRLRSTRRLMCAHSEDKSWAYAFFNSFMLES
ncbi:hypothetical protein EVAR_54415_1 [Eumeta japonica]|uniref:Uncharacterized protein n=1 Tax=Eumeta variegata TaxID=151549 RepID=A0A4C1Y430_EUMVA|nr:hypothetical protein EVAR_54415_1 [Eumeta japonica]